MWYRSAHYRRGHYRRTANGLVWVRATTVSGHYYTPGIFSGFGLSNRNMHYSNYELSSNYGSSNHPIQVQMNTTTRKSAKLGNFNEYYNALKELFIRNGRHLTDQQINDFIIKNGIDIIYGITLKDVRVDLSDIEKELIQNSDQRTTSGTYCSPQCSMASEEKGQPQREAKLQTYREYYDALMDLYCRNGERLTDQQIYKFIIDNGIYVAYGITPSDVKQDISSIIKELNAALINSYRTNDDNSSNSSLNMQISRGKLKFEGKYSAQPKE